MAIHIIHAFHAAPLQMEVSMLQMEVSMRNWRWRLGGESARFHALSDPLPLPRGVVVVSGLGSLYRRYPSSLQRPGPRKGSTTYQQQPSHYPPPLSPPAMIQGQQGQGCDRGERRAQNVSRLPAGVCLGRITNVRSMEPSPLHTRARRGKRFESDDSYIPTR